jgi:nitrous oxidase accessory protein
MPAVRLLTGFLLALAACDRAPRPLRAEVDACHYCRMSITDPRFGGELELATGRLLTFDATECLASFVESTDSSAVRRIWVSDFETSTLIPADSALFVHDGRIASPMGRGLVGVDARRENRATLQRFGGTVLRWPDVLALLRERRVSAGAGPVHAPAHSAHLDAVPDEDTIVVGPERSLDSISAFINRASGARVVQLRPGVYRGGTLKVARPLTIDGLRGATLDGEGVRGVIEVTADDVIVRGLVLRNTGASHVEDRAALRVEGSRNCLIENNEVDSTFFAIYLARVRDCVVRDNAIRGAQRSQLQSGNGVHVWQSEGVHVLRNRISGHRDGIYFEFVRGSAVYDNTSERTQRYALHFMFSDDCRYERNVFRDSRAGVAVMYTRRAHIVNNRFERNWGSGAYGLLLKDISDSEISGNRFVRNSTALYLEGSDRNRLEQNEFLDNGWALRVYANAQENVIARNVFSGNTFDVGTNSRQNFSTFRENYWDRYRGYDMDGDGIGDVPFAPVRLFALVVEQTPPALILLHSVIVDLLEAAERVLPLLTPQTLVDEQPLIRRPTAAGASAS